MRTSSLALIAAGLAVAGCQSDTTSTMGAGGGSTTTSSSTNGSSTTSSSTSGSSPDAEAGPNPDCPAKEDLISDFEMGNGLAPVGGRQGGWYTYGDMNGMFQTGGTAGYDIAAGQGNPNCSPVGSLHIKGMGFSMWGAAAGVDWRPRPSDGDGGYGDKQTYDASPYRGIAFWAKSSAPLDGVQVSFPDIYTDGAAPSHDMPDPTTPTNPLVCVAADGPCRCIYNAQSALNCSPYLVQFGLKGDAAADVVFAGYSSYQVDTTWKRFQLLFADTRQDPGNGGYHTPADKLTVDKLTAMAIQVNANYSTTPASARDFEIWIDDVSFIK